MVAASEEEMNFGRAKGGDGGGSALCSSLSIQTGPTSLPLPAFLEVVIISSVSPFSTLGGDSIALKKGLKKGPKKGPKVNLLQAYA